LPSPDDQKQPAPHAVLHVCFYLTCFSPVVIA
jgi:hypothetical protein